MSWLRTFVLVCFAALIGCGDNTEAVAPPDTTARERVKAALENVAESGQGGSELGAIMEELKGLEESDPALAEELTQDAQSFMSTQLSSDQIKQKAKDMLKKLEQGTAGG
jgi:hypothetical protein